MNVRLAGSRALLCEVADLGTAHRLSRAIVDADYEGVVDVVPGWRTVLVVFDEIVGDVTRTRRQLRALPLPDTTTAAADMHVIPISYDGPDLHTIANHTGLTVDEVVRRHTAAIYTVAFLGFQPGFPYLAGMDPSLATPRKETPRTSVPAGAVGIAGDVTGIYPRSSPGGWQLLGRTDLRLFDAARTPPALLSPGDHVRFEPVT